jgi:hypothetical protein
VVSSSTKAAGVASHGRAASTPPQAVAAPSTTRPGRGGEELPPDDCARKSGRGVLSAHGEGPRQSPTAWADKSRGASGERRVQKGALGGEMLGHSLPHPPALARLPDQCILSGTLGMCCLCSKIKQPETRGATPNEDYLINRLSKREGGRGKERAFFYSSGHYY